MNGEGERPSLNDIVELSLKRTNTRVETIDDRFGQRDNSLAIYEIPKLQQSSEEEQSSEEQSSEENAIRAALKDLKELRPKIAKAYIRPRSDALVVSRQGARSLTSLVISSGSHDNSINIRSRIVWIRKLDGIIASMQTDGDAHCPNCISISRAGVIDTYCWLTIHTCISRKFVCPGYNIVNRECVIAITTFANAVELRHNDNHASSNRKVDQHMAARVDLPVRAFLPKLMT